EAEKTKKRFGAVLVGMDLLEPKELFELVTTQVKRIVLSLFTWLDGQFRFEEGDLPVHEVVTLKMSTANVILSGIQQIQDLNLLRSYLPPGDAVLRMTDDPIILFQDIKLSNDQQDVLALVDGVRTENEVIAGSPLSSFNTMKLVYFFISIGLIMVPPQPAAGGPEKAARATPEEASSKEAVDAEMTEKVREEKQAAFFEMLHEHSLSQDETPAEAKTAVRDKIQKAFEAISNQNHYEVLGLDHNAAPNQIKKAYFRLAKEYHPDRHLQTGLEGLTSQLEALFQRATEAYDTLLTEGRRQEYDKRLNVIKSAAKKREGAVREGSPEDLVKKGEASLKRGEVKAAAYFFESALKGAPGQGRYHALLAKAVAKIKGRGREAESHYRRAI
ncbi:MAG TPA: DnaJ domain-containing protein, partial [Nitrospiria bacterium]|nr:DnaJ domain-containing protein [Nitrospiria bacterium]